VNTTTNILCGISTKISEIDWFGSFVNTSSGYITDFFNKPTWSMDIHQVFMMSCHLFSRVERDDKYVIDFRLVAGYKL
jgi:hypothetical protein